MINSKKQLVADSRQPATTGKFLTAIFLLSFPLSAIAQVSGVGTTSTNFQKIGMGARAVAMGESFAAVADDSTAIFWNPAGLVLAKDTQFSFTHGQWLQGVDHEALSFSQNHQTDGALGGSLMMLGAGSTGTLETPTGGYGGDGGTVNAFDYTVSAAYAQRLGNWIPGDFFNRSLLGLKATIVGQSLATASNADVAFDVGYIYEAIWKTLYFGAVVYNLGPNIQNTTLPVIYKLGGSYHFYDLWRKQDQLVLALETDSDIDTGFKFNLGTEYKMNFGQNEVALRAGYRTNNDLGDLAGLTTGVGVAHQFNDMELGLDYAFVPYGVLGAAHRISLNVLLGANLTPPQAFLNAPSAFTLGQTLNVGLKTQGVVSIQSWKMAVLDSSGTLVRNYSGDGTLPAQLQWDGKNEAGAQVSPGSYSLNMEVTDGKEQTVKAQQVLVSARSVSSAVTSEKGVEKSPVGPPANGPVTAFSNTSLKKPARENLVISSDLLFVPGTSDLTPGGHTRVRKMAGSLQNNHPGSRIAIAVHTDNLALPKDSKFTSEQELSDAQAKAVLEDLVQDGMDANSLTATGYGSSYPIKSNDTEAERARNRRVHFILLKAKPGDGEAALKKPAISGPAPESTSESPAPKP